MSLRQEEADDYTVKWQERMKAMRIGQKKHEMYEKGVAAGANEAQLKSLRSLIERYDDPPDDVVGFFCPAEANVIGVNFGEMWIGIEQDGYAHS